MTGLSALPRATYVPSAEVLTAMESPLVSVCLPILNGQAFLAEAIQSVLEQVCADFELIIVDDASDDDSLAIVRRFSDRRIRLVRNRRRVGIPRNWNRGLKLATGKYVSVFHQDDVMDPRNLARKVATLDADPTLAWVHSAIEPIVEPSSPAFSTDWLEPSTTDFTADGLSYLRGLILRGNCVCAPTVLARRELVAEQNGFNDALKFACDYELWMRLCFSGRVAYLATPLVRYRWHAGNATHQVPPVAAVAEVQTAAAGLINLYRRRTGRGEEADLLQEATRTIAQLREWLAQLEADRDGVRREADTRQSHIRDLEAQIAHLESELRSRDRLLREARSRGDARAGLEPVVPQQPRLLRAEGTERWPSEARPGGIRSGHTPAARESDSAGRRTRAPDPLGRSASHSAVPGPDSDPGSTCALRILFVIQGFPPDSVGGSEIHTAVHAESLVNRHRVFVFTGLQTRRRGGSMSVSR